MKNVLHVPDIKFNLISVAKLTKDLLCSVSFFPKFCVLQALYSGKMIGIGRKSDGLYLLNHSIKAIAGTTTKNDSLVTLWHLRLGHPSYTTIKHISSLEVNPSQEQPCSHICLQAKQSRPIIYDSLHKSSFIFQLIHVDVWDPTKHQPMIESNTLLQ